MDEKQQLVQRWDTFLNKIKTRCDELISQANSGTDAFIPQLLYDTNAISNAWTGIKGQIFQLNNKIDEAWEKMIPLSDKAGFSKEDWEIETAKGEELKYRIQWEYEKNNILAMAKAAKQVLSNVKAHINENKIHACTQCGNDLGINIYSFRAKNVKCDACGSVNTYKPDDRIAALEAWAIVPLANEYALLEKEAEYFAEEKRRYSNKSDNETKNHLIKLRQASINKHYQFLIDSIPEKADLYVRQRDQRLEWATRFNY